jgi:predicted RNA binding protein YcfA (HicA-like mRNA interferase family)
MKVLKVKTVIEVLEADGWFLYRHNGTSHRQFKHPVKKGKVTINSKLSDDVFGFILNSIEKQSGVKF